MKQLFCDGLHDDGPVLAAWLDGETVLTPSGKELPPGADLPPGFYRVDEPTWDLLA